MAQNKIVVTTTPPLPGTTLVSEVNAALQSLATGFAGNVDPASVDGVEPYVVWVDTLNGLIKRRNAAGTDWVVEGTLLKASLPQYAEADIPGSDKGPIYVVGKGPHEWSASAYKPVIDYDLIKWLSMPVGWYFPVADHHSGAEIPPTSNPNFRYIKLSASDPYNSGVLVSETVSGSAPNIIATATVSLAGSPMDGVTVDLINTAREFLRAGSSGTRQTSENLSHSHLYVDNRSSGTFLTQNVYTGASAIPLDSMPGWPSGGDESRPRNVGATYFMRIK